jgi:diguanylate cyclase (GGDEF)-like protein
MPAQALQVMAHERDQLARAQHKASAEHEKLARESATDGLTGITNRRHFDEVLTVEWSRAARNRTSLGLLIIDIDHFKRFNDHYGHVAGDECLRHIAQLLQTLVRRAGELVARYGGEEFVILLPGAGVAQAEDMARRCLDVLASAALPHASSPTARHVTVSIGVAQAIPNTSQDPRTIVNAADAAMYRAKTAGRARHALASQADWDIDKDAPRTKPGELI